MSDTKIPRDALLGNLKNRYEWKAVERPHTWRPTKEGEELIGFYGGKTLRDGQFGQYEVAMIHVPHEGSFMVSGTLAIRLFDAANIGVGWPVRVVWKGYKELEGEGSDGKKKKMKQFEVFIAEGDPIAPEYLPRTTAANPPVEQ